MVSSYLKGDLAQVFATTKSGKRILIAWQKTDAEGTYTGHSSNLTFFEKADGTLKTSCYQLGMSEPKKRRFVGTPDELETAFEQAGLPAPQIVRREARALPRSLRALAVAVGAPLGIMVRPQ